MDWERIARPQRLSVRLLSHHGIYVTSGAIAGLFVVRARGCLKLLVTMVL